MFVCVCVLKCVCVGQATVHKSVCVRMRPRSQCQVSCAQYSAAASSTKTSFLSSRFTFVYHTLFRVVSNSSNNNNINNSDNCRGRQRTAQHSTAQQTVRCSRKWSTPLSSAVAAGNRRCRPTIWPVAKLCVRVFCTHTHMPLTQSAKTHALSPGAHSAQVSR